MMTDTHDTQADDASGDRLAWSKVLADLVRDGMPSVECAAELKRRGFDIPDIEVIAAHAAIEAANVAQRRETEAKAQRDAARAQMDEARQSVNDAAYAIVGRLHSGSLPPDVEVAFDDLLRLPQRPSEATVTHIHYMIKDEIGVKGATLTNLQKWWGDALARNKNALRANGDNWLDKMPRSQARNELIGDERAVELALAIAPELQGMFSYDDFLRKVVMNKPLNGGDARPIEDTDYVRLLTHLQKYNIPVKLQHVRSVVPMVAQKVRTHCIRDYLNPLKWDGVPRLTRMAPWYLNTDDTPFTRAAGRWWMISAVARAFTPGCRVDHMLVLEGPQEYQKSTAFKVLFGEQHTIEFSGDVNSKKAEDDLRGKWCVDLAELASITRAKEVNDVKAYITKTSDTFRVSYGFEAADHPRSMVFGGAVNDSQYLADETGARRFWPLTVRKVIDLEKLARDRDQLWAEAVAAYRFGKGVPEGRWYPVAGEDTWFRSAASAETEQRYKQDDWEGIIETYLTCVGSFKDGRYIAGAARQDGRIMKTTGAIVALEALGLHAERFGPMEQKRIGKIMRRIGYKKQGVRLTGTGPSISGWQYVGSASA